MAISLTVGNETYQYPESGDSPGYGAEATAWAEAITERLADLQNPNDILETTFNAANNITTATNVNGLTFSNSEVRGARIEYTIYRTTSLTELAEIGEMQIIYLNNANDWNLIRNHNGDAGFNFTILPSGQVQYTSSNLAGTSHVATIKFRAKTLIGQ